jgi:hypothetical protein
MREFFLEEGYYHARIGSNAFRGAHTLIPYPLQKLERGKYLVRRLEDPQKK